MAEFQQGGKTRRKSRPKSEKRRKRRGTRKLSKGASDWNKSVMKVWGELKKKGASFSDALKETSRRKKAGLL
jgi:hypothetical protein